jgi:hypothetical protein
VPSPSSLLRNLSLSVSVCLSVCAGYFAMNGMLYLCPPHSFSATNDSVCSCLPGYIASFRDEMLTCTACPAGSFELNGECAVCAMGSFAPTAASTACTAAPAGEPSLSVWFDLSMWLQAGMSMCLERPRPRLVAKRWRVVRWTAT